MKYDINKTEVVPYIIAERALWNVLLLDSNYKDKEPMILSDIVSKFTDNLVDKAEKLFNTNTSFRKQLLDKRKDIRYTLESFMEHWSLPLIKSIPND